MCDSGGAYGRNWERNQSKTWEDFTREPLTVEAHVYTHSEPHELELMGTISLACYMENNLQYNPVLQAAFDAYSEQNPDEYDMSNMESFAEKYTFREKYSRTTVCNSYNEDNCLSQNIQFIEFSFGDEKCVLLQVHGGCDARGGYTSPKAYTLRDGCDGLGDWNINCWGIDGMSWDGDGRPEDGATAHLFKGYSVFDFEEVGVDLKLLEQTDHDNAETRAKMVEQNILLNDEAFEEAVEKYDIVVRKGDAYFKGEKITGLNYGLMG
jgi:hypothetical protein